MTEPRTRWRPSLTSVVAGGLVIVGFVLTGVSWWFLLLVAAGTFGPGLLREMGWLQDRDEFQRRADHRAGYHAFLATGFVAFGFVAYFRSGERLVEETHRLATLLLALLWFTWFVSSLLAYWGPQKTARRILYAFGLVWLVFAIVSNVGSEWTGWAALLLHPLLAAPFFALAWTSRRWPRASGLLLLGVTAYFFHLFFMPSLAPSDGPMVMTDGVVLILFLGPLLASGLALLAGGLPEDDEG